MSGRSIKSEFALVMKIFCVLALSFGLLPPLTASAAGITYYVAVTGSDTNTGTSSTSPYRTITKCAQVMAAGDTCVISSGTYRETVTPANSGTSSSAAITFQAAPGATVIVSGTEIVSGWSPYSGSIYQANLSWDMGKENQLFIRNGTTVTPLWEARWPNIGTYTLPGLKAGTAAADSGSATTLVDSDLPGGADFWKGATVWERGGYAYVAMTSKVTGYDNTTHTLTYNPITGNFSDLYPKSGSPYFLSGVLGALDAPNEWYVDAAAQKVYLWAPGGGSPTNVEVKKRKTAFNLNGKDYIHITGIQTFAANITMSGSNYNVLDSMDAQYIYFSNFSQSTSNFDQLNGGISISGHDNEIKNSTIAYSSGTLVNIDGSNNRIVNNVIHDGSYIASYDPLVKLSSGTGNLISRNEIRGSGRYNIYWGKGSGEISYNDISDGMWLSRDGALIYSWGIDTGNSNIHHNLIHDSKGEDASIGLYFDNYTENAVVHHNVIYNNDTGIQLNTPGNFKLIYNNTVVNNKESMAYWGSAPYKEELYGTRVFNNILTDKVSLTEDTVRGFNTITADGLNFVNASANNYRLSSGSTAINTGAILPGITDGYNGLAPDAGAYEFGGTDWTAGPNPAIIPGPYTQVDTPYMNLVKDSAFENGTDGNLSDKWLVWSTVKDNNRTVDLGATNLSIPAWQKRGYTKKVQLGLGGGVEQLITGLKPNTSYKFVAWVYNEQGASVNVGVLNYGGAAIDVNTTEYTKYVRQEVTFTTGATNTSARVRIWKDNSTTLYSYADDTGLFEVTPFDSGVYKNQALNKTQITASGALSFPERLTDGSTSAYSNMDNTGPQWVQIDLGQSYSLDKINVLHYYTSFDQRTYHDVIVQVSNDSAFAAKRTVFNNDTDNSAGQGTGTDAEYVETSTGKVITFSPAIARYIRLWTNGNTKYPTQHYTEVEAWGIPSYTPTSPLQGYKNLALGMNASKITSSSTVGNAYRITDGLFNAFANQDALYAQWIQLDLGISYSLDKIKLWHFVDNVDAIPRKYQDVIIQLSNDPTFATYTTVFNNDTDNSSGQGAGSDAEYFETTGGKEIYFPTTNARYIRLWAYGNNRNTGKHYVEVEVDGSPTAGMGT
ncbi:discoidin domain-containing protein [Paenibacillus aurantius]|uniref:Discoidin domain-containing protein n=1 Tax=Paenibacillus aurantius TaxID=2918900 RepID=A0AA96LE77_9BACL|nr:discoidin domain-containing protein [Paenibacillus aurantius]WNQ11373.1 discoidin domain-containing protein [Paenibacillus aurantius]